MASRRIVDGLLDAVFDAFGPVYPGKVMGGQSVRWTCRLVQRVTRRLRAT